MAQAELDLVARAHRQIKDRIAELEPVVVELRRLKQADKALTTMEERLAAIERGELPRRRGRPRKREAQEEPRPAPRRARAGHTLHVQTVGTPERELTDREVAWTTQEPQ